MTNQSEPNANREGGSAEEKPLRGFVNHQRKAYEEAVHAVGAFFPAEFKIHGRVARDEFLKSFKVLIDGAAKMVDEELKRAQASKSTGSSDTGGSGPSTTGKSKVKVDVS